MAYFHWRDEVEPIKPGLNLYPFSCKHSIGFILNLDRVYCRLRYSKNTKKWFWQYERRAPRAWRILKGEEWQPGQE